MLNQSLTQLRLLGFNVGDRIFVRCIAGKGFDVREDKLYPFDGYLTLNENGYSFTRFNSRPQIEKGKPLEKFTVKDGHRYLSQQNLKGYGVYLIPNMGGRKDEEITRCLSFFYECDDISKHEQWQRLKRLNFDPSLVIETRNSLHVYYRTVENTVEGWRKYQQRLIQLMDSDSSIHNESRLMRLAGFYHQKKGLDPLPIQIAYQSDAIYNRNQFDEVLPDWDNSRWGEVKVKESPEEIRKRLEQARLRREQLSSNWTEFPLEICLSKDDRDLITSGVSQGGRNANGFKLASNLIATENWLTYAGYHFTDTADDLFNEFCDRCLPPISNSERHSIWLSASRGNPSPSLTDEAIENCIKAWQWHQLGHKQKIDRFDEAAYHAYAEEIRERERVENAIATEEKIERFKTRLKRVTRRVSRKLSKFVATIEGTEFSGSRQKQWLKLISQGKCVLDGSFMGSGKTHAVLSLENNGGKVWYVSQGHRNPTVEGITDNFTDLMPRSQYGYVRVDGKLVEANEDTPEHELEVKKNCIRANLFRNLSNKGYEPDIKDDGKENPICATCPMKGVCVSQEGWYRYDRRETLKQPKIRCDIQSMPRDYDYSSDIIIIDEPSQSINPIKTINTDWGKLLLELDRVRDILPDEDYQLIDGLLQGFKPLFANKERYGLDHDVIMGELVTNCQELADSANFARPSTHTNFIRVTDHTKFAGSDNQTLCDLDNLSRSIENITTIIDFLEGKSIDLREIFKESDYITLSQSERKQYGHLLKYANAHLRRQAYKETLETLEKLPPNGLIYLLKALRGDKGITLRVIKEKLTITVDNRDSYAFLNRAKGLIFLDATLDATRLQTMTGLDRPIETIREKKDKPLQNLTIFQVKTEGIGSKQVSDTAINRIRELIKRLGEQFGDIPTIAHKSMLNQLDIDGYWFRDNRGSNDFQGQNLLSIGLPYPNVGAIEDEYFALYGGTLEGLEDYYCQRVNDEILQLVGRPRVDRFNRKFNLFMMTPFDADLNWLTEYGCQVIPLDAVEICPQSGNPYQVALLNIAKAIQETGANTQSAIAKHLGITRQAVSKLLRDHGLTLSKIIERVNCQPTLNNPNKDGLTLDSLVNRMRDLLDLDPIELAKEVIDYIKTVGWKDFFEGILSTMPKPLQHKVLGVLWKLLDTGGNYFPDDG